MNPCLPIIATLALFACTPVNQSDSLLGTGAGTIPAIDGGVTASTDASDAAPEAYQLSGLSRAHWPTIQVLIARGQVEAWPAYLWSPRIATGTVRGAGGFPSVATCLQSTSTSDSLTGDAAVQFISPAVSMLSIPVSGVCTPPWTVVSYPLGEYQLLPEKPVSSEEP